MLRVIGLSLIVSGMSVVSVALLRRELQFRLLTVIEIISYAVGFGVVGISMAMLGYGAWSLIAANIVQPLCLVALAVPFGQQSIWPCFGVRRIPRSLSSRLRRNAQQRSQFYGRESSFLRCWKMAGRLGARAYLTARSI